MLSARDRCFWTPERLSPMGCASWLGNCHVVFIQRAFLISKMKLANLPAVVELVTASHGEPVAQETFSADLTNSSAEFGDNIYSKSYRRKKAASKYRIASGACICASANTVMFNDKVVIRE